MAATRLALLDGDWAVRMAPHPQVGAALAQRGVMRAERLVVTMAIMQQPRLDLRLWALLWQLADRIGRVHADGMHVDLPITHELLSHLAGARRPSASASLTQLSDDGRLQRSDTGWILTDQPPV